MKTRILVPLAAIALAFSSIAGVAADSGYDGDATVTEGTIEALDLTAHEMTLADGTTYSLPADYVNEHLKIGDDVVVWWNADGDLRSAIKIDNDSDRSSN